MCESICDGLGLRNKTIWFKKEGILDFAFNQNLQKLHNQDQNIPINQPYLQEDYPIWPNQKKSQPIVRVNFADQQEEANLLDGTNSHHRSLLYLFFVRSSFYLLTHMKFVFHHIFFVVVFWLYMRIYEMKMRCNNFNDTHMKGDLKFKCRGRVKWKVRDFFLYLADNLSRIARRGRKFCEEKFSHLRIRSLLCVWEFV